MKSRLTAQFGVRKAVEIQAQHGHRVKHGSNKHTRYRYERVGHYRSTSPNTISSDPRMAETSASMWPRFIQSIA